MNTKPVNKKLAAAGVAALAMTGGSILLAGVASADDSSTSSATSTAVAGASSTAPADAPARHMGRRGPKLDAAASFLGTTVDELRTRLQAGETLAQIAGDRTDALVATLTDAANARLDQAVTDGKLSADKAAELKTKTAQRITDMVNGVKPTPPAGAPAGTGTERPHGPRGPRPTADASGSTASSSATASTAAA